MTPLICPSPTILDQSFPRDEEELRTVAIALAELQACIQSDRAHIILTNALANFVEMTCWEPPRPYPLLVEIDRLLRQWFLQPHNRVLRPDVDSVRSFSPHPIPEDSLSMHGLVQEWADEVGKLRSLHNSNGGRQHPYVGVACCHGFAGEETGRYPEGQEGDALPLVGPDDLDKLGDAYEWEIPADLHKRLVSFQQARKHITVLGAWRVKKPPGGSHYKCEFRSAPRPWILDPNTDPLPDRFIAELVEITKYPLEVVKIVLLTGEFPSRRLRLPHAL